jgi:hypothetical protein
LVNFLLSKRIFERVEGVPLFWLKGWRGGRNYDLRPTMIVARFSRPVPSLLRAGHDFHATMNIW